jgi:hypothetical protein
MRFTYRALLVILITSAAGVSGAQVKNPIDRITQADLKADLFALAGDAMRGREAGTIDELNTSMWIAERCRAIGLAIGRAVAAAPGRRTSLFIWHGAEERGLMGSCDRPGCVKRRQHARGPELQAGTLSRLDG